MDKNPDNLKSRISRRTTLKAIAASSVGLAVGSVQTVTAANGCGSEAQDCWSAYNYETNDSDYDQLKKSQSMDLTYYGKIGEYQSNDPDLAIHEFQLSALSAMRYRYSSNNDWQRVNERGKRIGSTGFRIVGDSNVNTVDAANANAPLTVGQANNGDSQSSPLIKNGARIAETLVAQNPVVGTVIDSFEVLDALHDIVTNFNNDTTEFRKYWDGGDFAISPELAHQVHFTVTVPVTTSSFSVDVYNMCELEGQTSGYYNTNKELVSMSKLFATDGSGEISGGGCGSAGCIE
jgi:hypothetical protein